MTLKVIALIAVGWPYALILSGFLRFIGEAEHKVREWITFSIATGSFVLGGWWLLFH